MSRPRRSGRPSRGGTRPSPRPGGEGTLHGLNAVEAALRARRRTLKALCLKTGELSPRLERLQALARELKLPVSFHPPGELDDLAGSTHHQGALLRCGALPLLDDKAALDPADGWNPSLGTPPPLLVALDQVSDPRNLGAVVRSCAAFGASGLVLPKDRSAPLSAAASSASAGSLETFPVHETPNMARFLDAAKSHGFWVAGAVSGAGDPLPDFRMERPLVLVLGSEGRGMRPLVERQCDFRLSIPLPGLERPGRLSVSEAGDARLDSLNVASAAAVLLYALTLSRR